MLSGRGEAQLKCLKHTQVLKMLCTSLTDPFIFVTCSCSLWAEGLSLQVMVFRCFICRNGLKVAVVALARHIVNLYNLRD
ncbi:hypothetical protein HanXRQr2_Chr08g0328441 [Helianthus annuus]|uniref:Uncharacterized protein n=1 Tax=Helianthus annuus TaxID=4232 RepID=A0A9K3ICL4_HELAN|nr:hypothetical protein HanXRQr2_Chr08g0328441 [Helianthus annuus]